MLREGLTRIAQEYRTAKQQDLRGHPLAQFIRSELPTSIQQGLSEFESAQHLKVVGPKMPGNWASSGQSAALMSTW